ncbi:MAG: hypothetical protein ABSB86_03985, partial [Bryobacteraceae bacterium]
MATRITITPAERRSVGVILRDLGTRATPALVLLAVTLAIFWKIALTGQFTWLNSPDLTEQVLPFFQEEAAQWHRGQFPIWDPHHWGGQSLLGQDQPGVLFPLNWLLTTAPLWHGHISLQFANWYFVLIHYLATLFCYRLARDLGLSSFASICAGASFGLSGYMGNTDWPQMLNAAMWAPLVLLFSIRALNGRRPIWNMALAGSVAGFSFYGGHHQIPIYTLLCTAFLLAFYVVFRAMRLLWAALLGATCLVFTVLIGAPQLLPSYEYWSRALRWVSAAQPVGFHDKVPYVVFDLYSLYPVSILGLVVPAPFPGVTPFVGITILSFALLAVIANWRARMVGPFAALGIFGVLFSLGKYSIFHGILYNLVPLLNKSRNASHAMFIADLALAVLAGFGIDCFLNERERIARSLRRMARVLLAGGALLLLVQLARGIFEGDKMFERPAFAQLAWSAILLACLLLLWELGRIPLRGAVIGVLGLILFDIGMVTTINYPHREQGWRYVDKLSAFSDLADYLRAQPGNFRVYRNGDDIGFNFGDWYGFDEYGGMGAGLTENMSLMNGAASSFGLMGVSYYLGKSPKYSDPEPLFRGQAGVNVYRVPGAFARAWPVHVIERIHDPSERWPHAAVPVDQLVDKTFVLGDAPRLDRCGGRDTVSVNKVGATELEIDADMACLGMVV